MGSQKTQEMVHSHCVEVEFSMLGVMVCVLQWFILIEALPRVLQFIHRRLTLESPYTLKNFVFQDKSYVWA